MNFQVRTPRQHSPNGRCWCGEPIRSTVYMYFRYPRGDYQPEAADPWNVHGCWPTPTCGSPACEAEAYAELLALRPGAVASLETAPREVFDVIEDDE
jgi:hypothetical protein